MSNWLKPLFLIHAVVAVVGGLPMLFVPGRVGTLFSWWPMDPVLGRILGAALLALAWSSWRGWRGATEAQVALLVEVETAFTVLTSASLLYVGLRYSMPWYIWTLLGVFVAFAAAWVVALVKVVRTPQR